MKTISFWAKTFSIKKAKIHKLDNAKYARYPVPHSIGFFRYEIFTEQHLIHKN